MDNLMTKIVKEIEDKEAHTNMIVDTIKMSPQAFYDLLKITRPDCFVGSFFGVDIYLDDKVENYKMSIKLK